MRLCRCGEIVSGRCKKCAPKQVRKSTADRGYGQDWRTLSERYRAEHPLCEVCDLEGRTTATAHCHHIIKIADAPDLRLEWTNLLSVCELCHERVEVNIELARKAKQRSVKW